MTRPGCKPPGMTRREWIQGRVAAKPLTDEQLDRLRQLLPPVRRPVPHTAVSGVS